MGYDLFQVADILFLLAFSCIFLLALGIIIVVLVKNVSAWHSNNRCPVLSVEATVVSKYSKMTRRNRLSGPDHTMTAPVDTASYFASFQVESGDRMELRISGREFGQLAEGDKGKPTFRGTRYRYFARKLY